MIIYLAGLAIGGIIVNLLKIHGNVSTSIDLAALLIADQIIVYQFNKKQMS